MKTLKSLLLGSSVALVAATGAQAADLIAEPAPEYVRVCDAFGTGFYYIPGTDTCLRIGGNFRYFTFFQDGDYPGGDAGDDFEYNMEAMFRLRFDARTQTELGTLRGFTEYQFGFSSEFNNTGTRYAFIQLGGLTAGQTNSFFRPFGTPDLFYRGYGNPSLRVPLLAYTFVGGNGFSGTISLEDPANTQAMTGGLDNSFPSIVANVRVDQSWGSAFLAGVVTDNDTADTGYGIRGAFTFNVMEGGEVGVSAAWGEGVSAYIGGTAANGVNAATGNANEEWGVLAYYKQSVSSNVNAAVYGTYVNNEDRNEESWGIGGNVVYSPVSGLDFGLDVYYVEREDGANNFEGFAGLFRINRSF